MSEEEHSPEIPVTVLLVDDTEGIRSIVRLALEIDGRYRVVGEAVDGIEGVAAAASLQPEVVLLDRSMPRMDGLEALPEIRAVAPDAAVILYTADSDAHIHHAAVAAGAVDVMQKDTTLSQIGTMLAEVLIRSASDSGDVSVEVGPVASSAALAWMANTRQIMSAVEAHPEVLDRVIEPEVFETFRRYFSIWEDIAVANDEFAWAGRAPASQVQLIVDSWASIDRIDDETLHRLGCEWSSPHGRTFFDAMTGAILRALSMHEHTVNLAKRLQLQWAPPVTG